MHHFSFSKTVWKNQEAKASGKEQSCWKYCCFKTSAMCSGASECTLH